MISKIKIKISRFHNDNKFDIVSEMRNDSFQNVWEILTHTK